MSTGNKIWSGSKRFKAIIDLNLFQVTENGIELVMNESLVSNEGLVEKLVTIDMERGEMVIEIPDKVLERGARKCGEIFKRGKDLMEEASRTLISN
jgi:hypothetical protein